MDSNLYEMSFEELAERVAKAPRRPQDASKLSEGVKTLVEDFEARKAAKP